jgi:4-diphosphocytidyl-2-C-methyl-D-erythritol kinase
MTRPGAPDPFAVYPAIPAGTDALVLAAPAKLNLFLEIHGRRPDGYHDLESLVVAVDLFDTLEIRRDDSGAISLSCDCPGLPLEPGKGDRHIGASPLFPTGADNLVVKAAEALRGYAKRPDLGAAIRLTKRIPTQAGLGGGSADAALALLGLNHLWKLALTHEELAAMGAAVGSDVPFFLTPPAAWCTGRGETVSAEPATRPLDFVLACPPVGLGTAEVYRGLAVPATRVPGDSLRGAFRAGDPVSVGRGLFNRLEEPAFALAPRVKQARDRLAALGPCGARMTGSGAAVFAVCRSRAEANRVALAYRESRPLDESESLVFVVRSLAP